MSIFARQIKPNTAPGFSRRAEELRAELQRIPAEQLALRTGSTIDSATSELVLLFNGSSVKAHYPELVFQSASCRELPQFQQVELLYYFACADGFPLSGKYVSFADLPGGRTYDQAYQGYTGNVVARAYGDHVEALKRACLRLNGLPVSFGDAAFIFQVLPRLYLQLVYWLGDEDFPSSCKVLFEATASHYFPIEGCAILGNSLVQKIIKLKPEK